MAPIAVRSTCLHVSSCLMFWWLRHQNIDPHLGQCSNKRPLPFGRELLCGHSLGKLAPCILVETCTRYGYRFRGPMRRYITVLAKFFIRSLRSLQTIIQIGRSLRSLSPSGSRFDDSKMGGNRFRAYKAGSERKCDYLRKCDYFMSCRFW